MNNSLNRFDWLARYYDYLARIVFGKTLLQSQLYFLSVIPPGVNVLIMGGGTGEILKFLLVVNPDCRIWYVEASGKMLSIASKKIPKDDRERVKLIHGTEKSLPGRFIFDAIITNFFLDLYPDEGVLKLCKELNQKLNKDGLWLVSDFVDSGKWWYRFMLWIMYRFFVLTCSIEGARLPSWQTVFQSIGLVKVKFKFFYGGFIKGVVYKKFNNH